MTDEELKQLYERKVRAMRARPSFAHAVGTTSARLEAGFACEIESSGAALRADQPETEGGAGAGPTPGQLVRAGIAACLAIGYKLWSARLGIPIEDAAVEMAFELDARGQMGVESMVPPGWQKIRYTVRIISDAPEESVRHLVETADRLSPMLGSIDRAAERIRTIEIRRSRP